MYRTLLRRRKVIFRAKSVTQKEPINRTRRYEKMVFLSSCPIDKFMLHSSTILVSGFVKVKRHWWSVSRKRAVILEMSVCIFVPVYFHLGQSFDGCTDRLWNYQFSSCKMTPFGPWGWYKDVDVSDCAIVVQYIISAVLLSADVLLLPRKCWNEMIWNVIQRVNYYLCRNQPKRGPTPGQHLYLCCQPICSTPWPAHAAVRRHKSLLLHKQLFGLPNTKIKKSHFNRSLLNFLPDSRTSSLNSEQNGKPT